MKKIINIFTYLLVIILIICICDIFYNKFIRKNKLPLLFNYYIFNVVSGSMEDELHVGDYILIKKSNKYVVGDIVTYKKDNYYITHRIVSINGNKVITKGDANNTNDKEINIKDIIGKYVYKCMFIGFLIEYKFFIIGLLLIFYIIYLLIKKE